MPITTVVCDCRMVATTAPKAKPRRRGPCSCAQLRTRQGRQRLALAVGAANRALGDQRSDLVFGIAELAEHLCGVLAEFRRGAAQARLGPLQPDRGGDALVPVLFDDVAAM